MPGKKRSHSKSKKKKQQEEEPTPEELDRFAGSSDEEEEEKEKRKEKQEGSDSDNNSSDEEEQPSPKVHQKDKLKKNAKKPQLKHDEGVAEDGKEDSSDNNDSDDADFEINDLEQQPKHGPAAMANAMSKILGPSFKPTGTNTSIILSKTTTPLQRLQQEEKAQAKLAREKRRLKTPLPALHIPLSVATTSSSLTNNNRGVTQELEQERLHRRVATRGVVALFNAVAQHQQTKKNNTETTPKQQQQPSQVKKLTKHGFLDLIKTTAAVGESKNPKKQEAPSSSKWAALQDDYMLNPKKNWDESSDDDSQSNSSGDDKEEAKEEVPVSKNSAKKRRLVAAT